MIFELVAFLGVAGIAIIIFAIIVLLSDKPTKAFIMALMLSYLLYFNYIIILSRILKRKEEKRATEQHYL